jgi:hypothetical protein
MYFKDYHRDDGILFPHVVKIETGTLLEQLDISAFKVNPQIDPTRFAPQ